MLDAHKDFARMILTTPDLFTQVAGGRATLPEVKNHIIRALNETGNIIVADRPDIGTLDDFRLALNSGKLDGFICELLGIDTSKGNGGRY